MKRLVLFAALALPICAFGQSAAVAAQAQAQRPASAVPRGMEGRPVGSGSIPIHEHPSNTESGVDTDRFIGTPNTAFTKVWNGLMTRSMLRAGDPYTPGPQGAVLEYRDDLSVATLPGRYQSGVTAAPGITFYYVQGGVGRVDMGPGTPGYDVHPGVGILFAPGAKQHFTNTGDAPISMIMMSWTKNDGMTVKAPLKVVDTVPKELGAGGNRAHWTMIGGKGMFNNADGVNITMSAIHIPPMSYTGPHAHTKGVEEIWVKTGFDTSYAVLGSEMRKLDGPGVLLAPPNGLTTHSSMNLNEDHANIWLYLSRRAPGAAD